jgi:hypothetical protein
MLICSHSRASECVTVSEACDPENPFSIKHFASHFGRRESKWNRILGAGFDINPVIDLYLRIPDPITDDSLKFSLYDAGLSGTLEPENTDLKKMVVFINITWRYPSRRFIGRSPTKSSGWIMMESLYVIQVGGV